MKNLKKIAFSIGLVICLLFMLEKVYDHFIYQNKNIKTNFIATEKVNAEILFEGSCIPYQTINPSIIENETGLKTYNLASNHSDLAENYLNIYLYLNNNPAPKIIFLFTGPETFDENYNGFNSYRYTCFVDDRKVDEVINELDPNYHKYLWFPFMKYAYYNSKITFPVLQGVKHSLNNKHLPYLIDGYDSPFKTIDKFNLLYKDLYKNQIEFQWSKNREKYLMKIINLCQASKIQLVLFDPPSLLLNIKKHQNNRQIIRKKIKAIALKNNIPFWIFDSLKVCYQKEKFVSNYHLIESESIKFNKSLAKSIKRKIKYGFN
jgi:hypothetical protein